MGCLLLQTLAFDKKKWHKFPSRSCTSPMRTIKEEFQLDLKILINAIAVTMRLTERFTKIAQGLRGSRTSICITQRYFQCPLLYVYFYSLFKTYLKKKCYCLVAQKSTVPGASNNLNLEDNVFEK